MSSTRTGAAPAHPQHHHEMLCPAWSQINQTNASPSGLPAQCFHCLQASGWPGEPGMGMGAMLQPGTHLLSGCFCWLPGKAILGRMSPKWGDSPLTPPLGTPLARPEMGRPWLSLQVHNQPGQNFDAICGLFPITDRHRGEEPTPKPAWPWAVGSPQGAAPMLCSQPARTKPVTKGRIKAPK